jgi:hypothetical protein
VKRLSIVFLTLCLFCGESLSRGQIDPEKRQLIQFGYNQPIEGNAPISGYLFYFRNQPNFLRTNTTLRLSIAPVYVDSELGFKGPGDTDFAAGFAGGGFADSYFEMRRGKWIENESFTGHGGEVSFGLYHRFNTSQRIPLNSVLRVTPHFSTYQRDSDTADNFVLPNDRASFNLRTGLRWGGSEPLIWPTLGMELSGWYEGQMRTGAGTYGFGDRRVEEMSHLFWARALFIYTFTNIHHALALNLTAGTSLDADRFSAYRLGGMLPFSSEFPLMLPGYYFQELSAKRFALLNGQYRFPLDRKNRWRMFAVGSVAKLDYLDGLEQPGTWHYGVGTGIGYKSPSGTWQALASYSYGFNAIRGRDRGAQSIGFLVQWDLEARNRTRPVLDVGNPYKSRGLFKIFGD